MKILLVRNDNIGDLICTTPAIEALKKKYPSYSIDIVVNSYNYSAIEQNPFINKIYCYTKPKHVTGFINKLIAGIKKLKIILKIRKEKYDVVIVLRRKYSKSAELFSKITNAKYKIGAKNIKGKDGFNIYVDIKEKQHEVEFCFDCLDFFGVKNNEEKTFFYINKELENKYLLFKDFYCFHVSARMKNNQLSEDKISEILEKLDKNNIILTAEPKDYAMADNLSKKFKIKFVKTSSFIDLGALFKNLKFVITLEGGAMHLAPAVGTKTIALFGQSEISRWYPWGYENLVIQDSSKVANNIKVEDILELLNKEHLNG